VLFVCTATERNIDVRFVCSYTRALMIIELTLANFKQFDLCVFAGAWKNPRLRRIDLRLMHFKRNECSFDSQLLTARIGTIAAGAYSFPHMSHYVIDKAARIFAAYARDCQAFSAGLGSKCFRVQCNCATVCLHALRFAITGIVITPRLSPHCAGTQKNSHACIDCYRRYGHVQARIAKREKEGSSCYHCAAANGSSADSCSRGIAAKRQYFTTDIVIVSI